MNDLRHTKTKMINGPLYTYRRLFSVAVGTA